MLVADVIRGKFARKLGARRKTAIRDFAIYNTITKLLVIGVTLCGNANEDGADSLISERLGMEPEAVLKAYQRYKKHVDSHPVTVDKDSGTMYMTIDSL